MQAPGNLFVVAAPSGTGKSTLVKSLLEVDSHLEVSVSHTTRAPRGQEQSGREYHFVDDGEFNAMIARGAFVEWARVHGHLYGTSQLAIDERLRSGQDIVLEIDWQGALQIRQRFAEAVLIFVLPPSREEQERRLRGRGDPGDKVLARLRKAELEEPIGIEQADHVVVNDELDRTVDEMLTIIDAERHRARSERS